MGFINTRDVKMVLAAGRETWLEEEPEDLKALVKNGSISQREMERIAEGDLLIDGEIICSWYGEEKIYPGRVQQKQVDKLLGKRCPLENNS